MVLPMVASADTVKINGIWYNLVPEAKTAEVSKNPSLDHGSYFGTIVIPEKVTYNDTEYSVTSIGSAAFYGCDGLTSITIPNSVTSIGSVAFRYCYGLTSVTIPNSVTSIGESAFRDCSGLTSITIPNSVTHIGDGAFYGCSGLTSISIPNSVTSIGSRAFGGCSGLTSVIVEEGNTKFDSRNSCNAIIITSSNVLITGCMNTIIPNSVTRIGDGAFSSCSGLTSISIPNSVTRIDDGAFNYCSGLTSVTIGNSVTNIYGYAFAHCPELIDVTCLAETVPSTYSDAFDGSLVEYATLHVPYASVNSYKAAKPWKNFKEIIGLSGTPKCAAPTISYQNGKLSFSCETEGADFVSEIADADVKKWYDTEVQLTVTYNISVYATKTGYYNSDVATATLCWIEASPQTEGISNGIAQVPVRAVMIQSNGGMLNIQGIEDGTSINVYNVNGVQIGSAVSNNGLATVNTTLQPGSVTIVKIGERSVKVVVK